MMRRGILVLGALLAGAGWSLAQMPAPPEQLGAFKQALGNWEGSGTLKTAPDATATAWQARMTIARILGGHFVQQDLQVTFKGGGRPMVSRRIYGYDRSTRRFNLFSVDNTGLVTDNTVWWTKDGRLTGTRSYAQRGALMVEHWESEFWRDSMEHVVRRWDAGAGFFESVRGKLRRGGPGFSAARAGGSLPVNAVGPEMLNARGYLGKWRFAGIFSPSIGGPLVKVAGRYGVQPLMGGHALLGSYTTDSNSGLSDVFQGRTLMAWDAQNRCYQFLDINNSGKRKREQGYLLTTGRIVQISSGLAGGRPFAMRTVITFSEDHDGFTMRGDRSAADGANTTAFDLTFRRLKHKESRP